MGGVTAYNRVTYYQEAYNQIGFQIDLLGTLGENISNVAYVAVLKAWVEEQ